MFEQHCGGAPIVVGFPKLLAMDTSNFPNFNMWGNKSEFLFTIEKINSKDIDSLKLL
jgi:hypothetical protein